MVVTATHQGEPLGQSRARFIIYQQDLERDKPAADLTLMNSLAEMTADLGGRAVAPERLPELVDQIKSRQLDLEVRTPVKQSLWDNWPLLILLVALLSVEWFLRKRWGLV